MNPSPLWVSDINKAEQIDPCILCGKERTFEFQIMPQLLNYLNINNSVMDSIDWGTLVIFSCKLDCKTNSIQYSKEKMVEKCNVNKAQEKLNNPCIQEIIWRQMYSSDGIDLCNRN